ncbi:hypothetical protein V1525DRAFT_408034 [Lipomyces kononenkoae]|uniref:Uncharacterized protein n=1 Tax=Lipomyces kononenkoae TaxID=34357 RepID=A0ACC3SXS6_LIPKO
MGIFEFVANNIYYTVPIPVYVAVLVVLLCQVFRRIFISRRPSIMESTPLAHKTSDLSHYILKSDSCPALQVTPDTTYSWRDKPQEVPREIKPGKYFLTMNIRKLDPNDYIIFDERFLSEYRERQAIIENVGPGKIFVADPSDGGALDLCEETLVVTVDFLVTRYPSMFRKTERGVFCIDAGEEYDLVTRPWSRHPLEITCLLSGEDHILIRCCDDGTLRVAAVGLVYSLNIDWRSFIGKELGSIHKDAHVPFYESALQKSVDRYFQKLPPDKLISRANWLTQVGPELRNDNFPDKYLELVSTLPGNTITPETIVNDLYIRVERQAMRKLPSTNGVVFKFRVYATNIWDLEQEEGIPRRFADHIRGLPEPILRQKHCLECADCILKAMDFMAEQQEKEKFMNSYD